MVIDYVWHFWVRHEDLTHFAADYWVPLPSVLVAGAMKVWGPTAAVAVRASVIASIALAASTWLFGRAVRLSHWAALASAAAVFVALPVTRYSVQVDSSLYYSVFVVCSLALAIRSRDSAGWRWALGSGAMSGCAHLCRNDGVLLLASLVLAGLWWLPRQKRSSVVMLVVGHLAVLAPYALASLARTGNLMPGNAVLAFLVDYEDLYRLPPGPSLADTLRMGLWEALLLRQRTSFDRALDFVRDVISVPALVLMLVTGTFLGSRLTSRPDDAASVRYERLRHTAWLLPGSYASLLFAFHSLITPVASAAGAYSRSLPAVLAILVVAAMAGLGALRVGPLSTLAFMGLFVVWPWHQTSSGTPARVVHDNNEVATRLEGIQKVLDKESRCVAQPIVVMTRDPWELTELTGYRSVQIPNESLDVIVGVAKRFGVTHLIPSPRRRGLADARLASHFVALPGSGGLMRASGLQGCP